MNGLSILMFIFAFFVFLAGLYLFTGHKNEVLLWKCPDITKVTDAEVRNIGKWTMISSLIILAIGIIALFLDV